jgi:hypothetical protein
VSKLRIAKIALIVAVCLTPAVASSCSSSATGSPPAGGRIATNSPPSTVTQPGGTWSAAQQVAPNTALASISCASPTYCVAVGGTDAYTFNGSSWSSGTSIDPDRTTSLTAVSCPTTIFCAAVDGPLGEIPEKGFGGGVVYLYSNGQWAAGQQLGSPGLDTISCASADYCVAGGLDPAESLSGYVFTYNGSSWSGGQDIGGETPIADVSCPTTTFCTAVSGNSQELQHGEWKPGMLAAVNDDSLTSVSCNSPRFCMVVSSEFAGQNPNAEVDSDGSLSLVPLYGGSSLVDVSCTTSDFCIATDSDGQAFSYSGGTWSSSPSRIGVTDASVHVSCVSPSFCAAVSSDGDGFVYRT